MVITAGIHQHHIGAVLHLIAAIWLAYLTKRRIEALRHTENIGKVSRHAQKIRMEVRHIIRQTGGRVARRVDR